MICFLFDFDKQVTHKKSQPNVLKGRSFWEISASTSNSWNWRKLLQLRTWANRFVDWQNGTGVWKMQDDKYKAVVVWNEIRPRKDK